MIIYDPPLGREDERADANALTGFNPREETDAVEVEGTVRKSMHNFIDRRVVDRYLVADQRTQGVTPGENTPVKACASI